MSVKTSSHVAPLVGAWIEIFFKTFDKNYFSVAPLVGAWIEIFQYQIIALHCLVAPLVGAWIEISDNGILANWVCPSRSSRGSVD